MERRPGALTLSEDDRRVLAVWAADCAERTLSLFEAQAPNDTRPRKAIDGLRAFARGELRIGQVRALAARAHAAAREVDDPAAVAAARAAGQAAGTAHMAAHARGAAAYAAKAAGLAAPHDPTAVADEVRWQLSHASPTVREVLRKLPPPTRSAGLLGALISALHPRLSRGRMTLTRQRGMVRFEPEAPFRSGTPTPGSGCRTIPGASPGSIGDGPGRLLHPGQQTRPGPTACAPMHPLC